MYIIKKLAVHILATVFLLTSSTSFAAPNLVSDPNVVTGKLDNGFSYYLYKSNDEEKDDHDEKISIRLYVTVGSLDEDDQQKGYAHLVEHLGFRDSRYFTHDEKSEFLENLGLHTNAYTTYNRTVYYINDRRPTDERMVKNLKLFRDFADGMFITQSDFELERKIVLEELRLRAAKENGIRNKIFEIYDNGQYLDDKKPIGTKEVLNAATQQSVKAFFTKWYQPQYMHFIVTGQIDVVKLEAQIKATFGDMSSTSVDKQPEPDYKLPTGIHFTTADDATRNAVTIIIPLADLEPPIVDTKGYQNSITYDFMVGGMDSDIHRSNDRLGKTIPYIKTDYYFQEGRAYLEVYFAHKENELNKALEFALSELATLRKHGFNQSQFENQLSFIEKREDEPYSPFKTDGRPRDIADDIVADLDAKEIHVSEADEALQAQEFLDTVKRDEINTNIAQILQNKASLIVVSREDISQTIQDKAAQLIAAFNDQSITVNTPNNANASAKQIAELTLDAGEIIVETTIANSEIIKLKLSNGATAYLLKRKKNDGHIHITVLAKGGQQGVPLNLVHATNLASPIIAASGLGGLNQQELGEYLNKNYIVALNPIIGSGMHGFAAKVKKRKGLEALFKVLHMNFYQGKVHAEQFTSIKSLTAESYAKWATTENGQYHQQKIDALFSAGKEYFHMTPKQINAISQDDIKKVYQHLFGDLSKFHFVIAGDIDVEQTKQLIEQYIANIPTQEVTNSVADIKLFERDISIRATNNPKEQSQVAMSYHNKGYVKSFENNVSLAIAGRVLTKRIYDIMRKEEGLTYGVSVRFSHQEGSVENSSFNVVFSVKPENEKQAIAIVDKALQELIDKPITEEEFIDKRDKLLEDHQKVRKSNASNAQYIARKFAFNYSMNDVVKLEDIIKNLKYEKVRDDVVIFLANSKTISTIFSNQ